MSRAMPPQCCITAALFVRKMSWLAWGGALSHNRPLTMITTSFEFFPPKTPALEAALWRAVDELAPLQPAFVSVTYGAGGSTRDRTHDIVARLQGERQLNAAAHLTCVGASRFEIDEIAARYWEAGIRHIVALRGDPPAGAGKYVPHPDGYANTAELVAGLKKLAPFEVSVGGYPETHPEAVSPEADLYYLRQKVEAGADRIITQFFFDNDAYFRFVEKAHRSGILVPIVPGILPITNFARACEFAGRCNTRIPEEYHRLFAGFDEAAPLAKLRMAGEAAFEQCVTLKAGGVKHFHFYTLNRADLVVPLCRQLGVAETVA